MMYNALPFPFPTFFFSLVDYAGKTFTIYSLLSTLFFTIVHTLGGCLTTIPVCALLARLIVATRDNMLYFNESYE
jgi:hypothetical protein